MHREDIIFLIRSLVHSVYGLLEYVDIHAFNAVVVF